MSIIHALAEMERQLLAMHQAGRAETMLGLCGRDVLEPLLGLAEGIPNHRAAYIVKQCLRRLRDSGEAAPDQPLYALEYVFNRWCMEGARSAIRAVLPELNDGELDALAGLPGLDVEVVSMMRAYADSSSC